MFSKIQNLPKSYAEMGFWGLTAYSAAYFGNFSLGLDLGYNSSVATSKMVDVNVESDSQSSTWTAGLRGSYFYRTDFVDIIPHVAVRFTGSRSYKYTVKAAGIDIVNVDDAYQSNFTFPVGVKFAKSITTDGGWTLSPSLDLYVTPVAGDLYARGRSHPVGQPNNAVDSRSQILDTVTYTAAVGFDISNGAFSMGLNYNFDASPHRAGHNIGLNFRYEF